MATAGKTAAQAAVFIVGSLAMMTVCIYIAAKVALERMLRWVIRHP